MAKKQHSDVSDLLEYEIYPHIDRASLIADLRPVEHDAYYTAECPVCGQHSAFLYKDSVHINCNRQNNCGASTSLWDFLQQRDNLSNHETLQALAESAKYTLPVDKNYSPERAERKRKIANILEECQQLFSSRIFENQELGEYLDWRGYDYETVAAMGLGCFPPIEMLRSHLLARGYSGEEIKLSQILEQRRMGDTHVLTIPFRDPVGQLKGFTVRTITPGVEPKYLHTKGELLDTFFNFRANQKLKDLVVMEGALDALNAMILSGGRKEFVAAGSNKVTESQLENAKKHGVKNIILCLDNDKAGRDGTERAIRLISRVGLRAFVVQPFSQMFDKELNNEAIKDPDEFIRKHGISEFLTFIRKPFSAARYIGWQMVSNKTEWDLRTDIGREKLLSAALEYEDNFVDPLDADEFIGIICEQLKTSPEKLRFRRTDVKEKRRQEDARKAFSELLRKGSQMHQDGMDKQALELMASGVAEIRSRSASVERTPYTLASFLADIKSTKEGLATGYEELDKYVCIKPGTLSYIAGRPSHGKSTVLQNLSLNMALAEPDKVFPFISIEEVSKDVSLKMINILSEELINEEMNLLQLENYLKGDNSSRTNIERSKRVFDGLTSKGRIVIVDDLYDIADIEAYITHLASKHEIGAVFIDYIQKIRTSEKFATRQLELQAISSRLLELAKRLKIAIVLGAQLGRSKGDKEKVRLDNLREAGDIENDANLVIGLWNEATESAAMREEKLVDRVVELEFIILKNRNGVVNRSVFFEFDRPILKIRSIQRFTFAD